MTIAIGEDHLALHDAVRRFTADRCPPAVVRDALDADEESLPPFWEALSALGWLGLALPEADGGEGYGCAELAVVLEELGRVAAPGPALTTTWAALVLGGASGGVPAGLVADLAAGRVVGAVALGGHVREADGALHGATDPVLCGGLAEVVVVPVQAGGAEAWCLVERRGHDGAVRVAPVASLDPSRRVACVELDGLPALVLDGVGRDRVEQLGLTLAAAECAGGAAWCVETAAAYARERHQFGRPIGQFQAVKHRCADMLVHLEQLRAVAWDAAAAVDSPEAAGPEALLAGTAAGAVAFEAFVDVAKDCIQVLGGIGFTWEHDAHLHLRRAVVLRQLFGGAARWRQRTANAALGGARRQMRLPLPAHAEGLRAEVRAAVDAIAALAKDERRVPLAEAGLIVPHWPPPWGRGAGAVEQVVIDEELRRARVRVPHLAVGAWAAPTIVVHGTAEQQERWVGPTLRGELRWCQLFSEPDAGSDLAALRTSASRADGGWLLNGQKVWTTMAADADWGICLARTNPAAPKHLGITYFVVDMRAPGIEVRPLRELTGLEMFNEVFLHDVFVPDDCVVGDVDGGWALARTTLANERVSMGSGSSFGGGIESLLQLVQEQRDHGAPPDAAVLAELGALVAEAHSVAVLGLRTAARSLTGAAPGPEASVRKLLGVEHDQRTQELGLTLLGPAGATTVGAAAQWTYGFLANRCLTIAGGTSEIQRNVIGERLLGLPRD